MVSFMMSEGPENISDILARLFTARGWSRQTERTRLETAWAETIDPSMKGETRVVAIRRGVLEIEVKNAVLIQELSQFHKRRLLTDIRKRLPGTAVVDLKFRAGAW
jgi:predicted nucleic acid-binding Zn ribbon protein